MSVYRDRYVVIIVYPSVGFTRNVWEKYNIDHVIPTQYGQNLQPLDLAKVWFLFLLIIFRTKIN